MEEQDLSPQTQSAFKAQGIIWNEERKTFITTLHKDLYIKASEIPTEIIAKEFISLVSYLSTHKEFGVDTDWQDSRLNKAVYLYRNDDLHSKFPNTINSLARYYRDSDLIKFYKDQGASNPIIIDLIGATGAGKTSFCQQFIDDDSKELLEFTISKTGQSTVIQTDILILKDTEKKMFLKVRNKQEIMSDILLVALNINLKTRGDNIDEMVRTQISDDIDLINRVSAFYSTDESFELFKNFASSIQADSKSSGLKQTDWLSENINNANYHYILDDALDETLKDKSGNYLYGYRHEYALKTNDAANLIIGSIGYHASRKENRQSCHGRQSNWLLYNHAILVLPCRSFSNIEKDQLDFDFSQGLVFRDSIGHDLSAQTIIASDPEIKAKIFLVPIGNSGGLIDNEYNNLFEKMMISNPDDIVFIITKADTGSIYTEYKESKDESEFRRNLLEKLHTTHNLLLRSHHDKNKTVVGGAEFARDDSRFFENYLKSFCNCYLSGIGSTLTAYKITYNGNVVERFNTKSSTAEQLDSWYNILGSILEKHKQPYYKNIKRKSLASNQVGVINQCVTAVDRLINYFSANLNWTKELDEHLSIFTSDYRSYRHEAESWYADCYLSDNNGTINPYFTDYTAELIRAIKTYVKTADNVNFYMSQVVEPLYNYLSTIYTSEEDPKMLKNVAELVILIALEKSVKIAYKVFDRDLYRSSKVSLMQKLYQGPQQYTQSANHSLDSIVNEFRAYHTYTEIRLCHYCILFAKFKYNLATHSKNVFEAILKDELSKLDERIKK